MKLTDLYSGYTPTPVATEPKKKAGRPKRVDTENLIKKPTKSLKAEKMQFSENLFWDWMADCALIVKDGWKLKTVPNKNWIEVVRYTDDEQMPFAFVDRKNGNIQCPAVMRGDPHEDIRGNISDSQTRLSCMTPLGVISFFPWQPTHPDYTLHKSVDFSTLNSSI